MTDSRQPAPRSESRKKFRVSGGVFQAVEPGVSPMTPPTVTPEWLRRWLAGEQIGASTGSAGDEPTYGYDGPDDHGYFAVPIPQRFMARLVEHAKAYAERNGLVALADQEALTAERDKLGALLEWADSALSGREVSEFALSFPIVRTASETAAALNRANEATTRAEAEQDRRYTALWEDRDEEIGRREVAEAERDRLRRENQQLEETLDEMARGRQIYEREMDALLKRLRRELEEARALIAEWRGATEWQTFGPSPKDCADELDAALSASPDSPSEDFSRGGTREMREGQDLPQRAPGDS